MRLKDRVAVVTGGSRGIGRAVALAFAKEGAKVCVNYVSRDDAARETVKMIEDLGGKAIAVKADVSKKDNAYKLIDETVNAFGRIDILVNNAGVTRPAMLHKMTEEEWDTVLNIHLKGAFLCTQRAAKYMMEQKYGRIINVTSVAGIHGTVGQINYSSAKGGLIAFTKSVARELARYNITCNVISLGIVETEMTEKIRTDEKLKEIYTRRILLGRFAKPEEVAPAFVFFASDESSYITGQLLPVDGGYGMT